MAPGIMPLSVGEGIALVRPDRVVAGDQGRDLRQQVVEIERLEEHRHPPAGERLLPRGDLVGGDGGAH